MKPDDLRKRDWLLKQAVKKAEDREKNGLLEEAAQAYVEAAKYFQPDNLDQVAICLGRAGICYRQAKDYPNAEKCLQDALTIQEMFNKDHPDTAAILVNLGNVSRNRGHFDKAEKCYNRALLINGGVMGESHFEMAKIFNNMGVVCSDMGKPDEAEEHHLRALSIIEAVLGKKHHELIRVLYNLGNIYKSKGDPEKAEAYFRRLHEIKGAQKNPAPQPQPESDKPANKAISKHFQNLQKKLTELEQEKAEVEAIFQQSKKLDYLGQMAGMMAHNINQPITVVRMAASEALSDVEEGKFNVTNDLEPLLKKIIKQTDRMGQMMGNFKKFAHGDRTILAAVNLNALIDDIYQSLFFAPYQLDYIEWHKSFSASPIAHANEWALQEMLISLLSNAREAVKGKSTRRVGIKTWQQGNLVGFCVEDNGDGVAEENIPKLFTPFLSTKNTGMGLGLYFCQKIVTDLGGSIDYYSSSLGGAGFRVSLPAQAE